jgi:hypothetical protein
MRGDEIAQKARTLRQFWNKRNTKFKEWYKLIQMVDQLEQDGMESFVGNDPRAAYNLVLNMLDTTIPHRIASEDLDKGLISAASQVEKFYKLAWKDIHKRYRQGLSEGFMQDLIGFLIATGWFSVFTQVTPDGKRCMAEVWNPATVYPNFGFDELIECSHIVELTPMEAQRLIVRNEWPMKTPQTKVTLFDYWWLDEAGVVHNAIALDRTRVKDDTVEERFSRIPVFVGAVGGLPDTGILQDTDVDRWKEEKGQSSIATNEHIYKYWNKWWTFTMQLLRDTAQPRIKEKSKGTKIVKPEDVFRRGAIWRMGVDEDVDFVVPPPIPVEMRTTQLDLEAMAQRGGPPWALYGPVQQQLTSYVFAQIASAAQQMAKPFHRGIINLISDIDNFWLQMIKDTGAKPYGFEIPDELPDDVEISAEYEIRIPGDLTRRATEARMLNPDFSLSLIRVFDEVFPEVQNPLVEIARLRAEKAERHPIFYTIDLIVALREQARMLTDAGEVEGARLSAMAADNIEAQLTMQEGNLEEGTPEQRIAAAVAERRLPAVPME